MNPAERRLLFDQLLPQLRPKLLRYCARMTGSAIDGEDVLQEAMLKAIESATELGSLDRPDAWLFRVAHNTALDFLRKRARRERLMSEEDIDMIPDISDEPAQQLAASASLRTFMQLPVAQRGSVILMDVLEYSLVEIAQIMNVTIPSVKASLHRGRERLRELSRQPEELAPPVMTEQEHALLAAYVDRFNARDFDAIRRMIADDVRVELVDNTRIDGRAAVSGYFGNYAIVHDWTLSLGFVDRRPAVLVHPSADIAAPVSYFVLLTFKDEQLVLIRDYRYARHVAAEAEVLAL
jgi:RNA polymerase sigma-70 factor (ECF subfamily)